MSEETKISSEEKTLMIELGITSSTKPVYFYKQHRYENLADAVRYAKREQGTRIN